MSNEQSDQPAARFFTAHLNPANIPDPRDAVVAAARSYIEAWDNTAIVWNDALHKRRDTLRAALKRLGR